MDLVALCQWMQDTSWATSVRESLNLYPALYTLHIFGFVIMVSATSALNLRLLGWSMRNRSVQSVAEIALPWFKWGLFANLATGFVVFASQAVAMYTNTAFRVKILLVLLVGVNILIFEATSYKRVGDWGRNEVSPFSARMTAAISFLLWFGIVAMSRVIGFTGAHE